MKMLNSKGTGEEFTSTNRGKQRREKQNQTITAPATPDVEMSFSEGEIPFDVFLGISSRYLKIINIIQTQI